MSIRRTPQGRKRSRESLDRRVDQWIETGRQFVDGVAGTRPGKRKLSSSKNLSGASLETVGRWVGDKLDWLLEDDEDDVWLESWQAEDNVTNSGNKRPLEAISRRVSQPLRKNQFSGNQNSELDAEWPEDSSFRVDRWQRSQTEKEIDARSVGRTERKPMRTDRRPLPKSSRRRD